MRNFTAVPVEEYLANDYSPDVDYVDGEIVERNVGEKDHSRLQTLVILYLGSREAEYRIRVFTEQRIQISPRRFRVPDICVTLGEPEEQIFTTPPFLCIEILSPEDRMSQVQEKIDDFLSFGVRYVWLINPESRRAWVYTRNGITEVTDGVLRTEEPGIAVPMGEVMR